MTIEHLSTPLMDILMIAEPTFLDDVVLIKPKVIEDERGYFCESFKDTWFRENVCDIGFVQDNQSLSRAKGTVRGLHYQQAPAGQGKLVRVLKGAIFDVAVDIRKGSKTWGQWIGLLLNDENHYQLWIPEGFAHGFCTLSPDTLVSYKVTHIYSSAHDRGIAYNDPAINVAWPDCFDPQTLSPKDQIQPSLQSLL